jgi:hypothetical protein
MIQQYSSTRQKPLVIARSKGSLPNNLKVANAFVLTPRVLGPKILSELHKQVKVIYIPLIFLSGLALLGLLEQDEELAPAYRFVEGSILMLRDWLPTSLRGENASSSVLLVLAPGGY